MDRETWAALRHLGTLLLIAAILVLAVVAAVSEDRMADECKASGGAWTSPGGCVEPHRTR